MKKNIKLDFSSSILGTSFFLVGALFLQACTDANVTPQSSIDTDVTQPSIIDLTQPAAGIDECKSLYAFFNGNDASPAENERYFSRNNKIVSCATIGHVDSMCSVAQRTYNGSNGFIQDRRAAFKMAQDAVRISEETGEDSALCRLSMVMWQY